MRHRSLSVRKEADVSAQLSSWPTQQLRMELTQEPLRVLVQHMRPKVKPVRSIEKFCGILMTLLDRSGGKLPRLAATQILNRSRNNSQCQALPLAECEHSSHRVVSSGAYSIIAEERPQLLRPSSCGLTPTQTVSHAPSLGLGGRVRLCRRTRSVYLPTARDTGAGMGKSTALRGSRTGQERQPPSTASPPFTTAFQSSSRDI